MKITYKQLNQLIKEQVSLYLEQTGASSAAVDPVAAGSRRYRMGLSPGAGADAATRAGYDAARAADHGVGYSLNTPDREYEGGRLAPITSVSPVRDTIPVQVNDQVREIVDSSVPRSLVNYVTRLARLLTRNQDAEAAQALVWIRQNIRPARTNIANINTIANAYTDRTRAASYIAWARSVSSMLVTLNSILPEALPPAGSPERQQLITGLTRSAGQFNRALGEWRNLFLSTRAPARTTPARTPSSGAPLVAGATGARGETLALPVAESRRRRGKKL